MRRRWQRCILIAARRKYAKRNKNKTRGENKAHEGIGAHAQLISQGRERDRDSVRKGSEGDAKGRGHAQKLAIVALCTAAAATTTKALIFCFCLRSYGLEPVADYETAKRVAHYERVHNVCLPHDDVAKQRKRPAKSQE